MLIYEIINKINNKKYIGLTSNENPKIRWDSHKREVKRGSNLPIHKALRKYGYDNFKFNVIVSGISNKTELNYAEKYLIAFYNTVEDGYNCTIGGEGHSAFGVNHHLFGSKNERISILNKSRKGIPLSDNHKNAIKKGSRKLKHTEENKIKLSEIKKQQWHSGIYSSDEYKEKQRVAKTGIPNPNKRKRIVCIESGEHFDSLGCAALKYNGDITKTSAISRSISTGVMKAYGFRWAYEKDYLNQTITSL